LLKLFVTNHLPHKTATMLRKFMLSSANRSRYILQARSSTSSAESAGVDLNVYHEESDKKLEELSDQLEEALEDRFDKGADVSLNNGVLTVVIDDQNTYVINKQTPNRQLWLSSPVSGPRRFDFVSGKWLDKGDKIELSSLLNDELAKLLKKKDNS
jgi:frataxin